jgi:hypothetical protein
MEKLFERCPVTTSSAKFDDLFDAILIPESTTPPGRPEPRRPERWTAEGTVQLEERVRAAVALFHRREYVRCLALLRDLECNSEVDPRVGAFVGACRALVHGEVRQGLDACVRSLKRAFYIPDLYCALGAVLLRLGDRSRAHAAYRRGLRVDPRHKALTALIREMGQRRAPVFGFLPRSHQANRWAGLLRARLFPA